MNRIKVAIIGTGHDHAADVLKILQKQDDIYDLVGFAIVPEDLGNCYEYTYEGRKDRYDGVKKMTVEEILNYPDLDAVCIETEDRALTKYALLAAKKGLNIHMDKPGGVDDKEYDKLIDTVKEKKLVFHLGYMYRYNAAVMKLKEDIKSGKLGEIYAVEAQMNCLHEADKREWLGNYPGGMLYFLGCHLIDLVYSIMGMPEEVIPLNTSTGIDAVKDEDFGMVAFKYKNGISFAKSTATEHGGFGRRQLVVCGSKGTVEIKPIECFEDDMPQIFVPVISTVREVMDGKEEVYKTEVHGRYDAMLEAFASYIKGERKNPFDYEYERELHKLILRACGKEVV